MTTTGPADTKKFHSLKLADWPATDRLLLQEARKPKTFLARRRRGLGMAARDP